jgi:sugar phosphate isomerase/epimerase
LNLAHFLCSPTPVGQLIDCIGAICGRAASEGIEVLVEFLPEGSISDLTTAADIVRSVNLDNCGLMFDTWHFFRTGGQVDELCQLPERAIGAVQVSDAAQSIWASGTNPPTAERLFPGEGVIPLADLIAKAMSNNDTVLVGAEVFSRVTSGESAIDRARRAFDSLAAVMGP